MALDVYLTNACNLRCTYCFNLDREDAPRIPLDDIRAILKAGYDRHNRYVSITGGEPFLYRQIFEVLDYAHDLGYWITILSHGGLLNSDRVERLKKYWRARIRISLDGPDAGSHDLLRGAGTFANTLAKISLLVESGLNVGVGVTVSENNIDGVVDILRLAFDHGIAFVRCVPVARVKKGKAAHVTAALHEKLLSTLIGFAIENKSRLDLPEAQSAPPPLAAVDALTTRRCMAGKHFFGITPDRKILPCSLIAEHPEVPTVYYEDASSFDELGRRMDALFERMKGNLAGICGPCEFREICYGGCLAEKLSFERGLADEQPVCTKLLLDRIRERFDATEVDRIVGSWVWQLQSSLEACDSHACMRQAPYWSVNFKSRDSWSGTAFRFN